MAYVVVYYRLLPLEPVVVSHHCQFAIILHKTHLVPARRLAISRFLCIPGDPGKQTLEVPKSLLRLGLLLFNTYPSSVGRLFYMMTNKTILILK